MNILIVEDDSAHQAIFKYLTKNDLSDVVADGYEAIAKVQEKRYDLVILDIKMPINGTEVLEYFKKKDPQMLERTVVVSALRKSYLDRLQEMYGVTIITKPFDLEEMRKEIEGR